VTIQHILVSNDDGAYAPGLLVLAKKLAEIADVTVVAPDRNRSGSSSALTLDQALYPTYRTNQFISVKNGTPADCVRLAFAGLFNAEKKFDLVVSGINKSANLGEDVFYSGTVGAAMEGRRFNTPALAVSLHGIASVYYATAAEITQRLILMFGEFLLKSKAVLNINVPDLPLTELLEPWAITRLGKRHLPDRIVPTRDADGSLAYRIGQASLEQDAQPGTDFYAINQKRVSITPLQLDVTDYLTLQQWCDPMNVSVSE